MKKRHAVNPVVRSLCSKDEWVPDNSTDQCHDCKGRIQRGYIYSGKHHCRFCGCIICTICWNRYFVVWCSTKKCVCRQCALKLYTNHDVRPDDMLTIVEMNMRIGEYYASYHTQYYNDGKGKFIKWCEDNDINQERMNKELRANESLSTIAGFDDSFPPFQNIENAEDRKKEILLVLKRLYDRTENLHIEIDIDGILCVKNIETAMKDVYKSFLERFDGKSPFIKGINDKNLLYFLTISTINRSNLLTNICDSYRRYVLARALDNHYSNISDWIAGSSFLRELQSKLKSQNNLIDNIDISLTSAIAAYLKRTIPPLCINNDITPCMHRNLINDDITDIVSWISSSCLFIEFILNQSDVSGFTYAPFMFDFIFLFNGNEREDDDDDYESDDDESEECISQSACFTQRSINKYDFVQLYLPFKQQMAAYDVDNYQFPRGRRFGAVVDRREMKKSKVKMVMFDPPTNCNVIGSVPSPENMLDLSSKCMVPKSDKHGFEPLSSRSDANGQMLSFSFSVLAENEIQCKMYHMGQCHRFYPQDIINVLPEMFVNDERKKRFLECEHHYETYSKRMRCLKDVTFESFYRQIHGLSKDEFPKNVISNQ